MPLPALATSCTRATARAIRVQDELSRRKTFDQPILGQLRSSVILVSKSKKTTFQIHHIAPSANVTLRLTLLVLVTRGKTPRALSRLGW
jgi:hypothetical protein